MSLVHLDGSVGDGGGLAIRTALALSAATGQGFDVTRIRARHLRPGLQPRHLAAVRAVAMACGARVSGAFEGSPDLRFEPGPVAAGGFRFEVGSAAATLLLETVLPVLAAGPVASRVEVVGGTHVPDAPSFEYLSRHWAAVVSSLGLEVRAGLTSAGFQPRGGGEVHACVERRASPVALALDLVSRGRLLELRGVSGSARLKGDVAERQRDGAQQVLWERRRLEAAWETQVVTATAPGSFLLLEAVFESGRAAFGFLGQRGVTAEALGDRAARRMLGFLDGEDGAVDAFLADQLVVPLALARVGGRVSTPEVTRSLETVARLTTAFGVPARVWGRRGGPGGVEVSAC